jgi:hypothetical protein
MTLRVSGRALSVALLSAAVALAVTGCGGGSSEKSAEPSQPAPNAATPADPTPESCFEDVGVDTMAKTGPKTWRGVHSSGYVIRVQRFNSPAAALHTVQAASGVLAFQANFFVVSGPIVAQDDGSTKAVARCLRGTP